MVAAVHDSRMPRALMASAIPSPKTTAAESLESVEGLPTTARQVQSWECLFQVRVAVKQRPILFLQCHAHKCTDFRVLGIWGNEDTPTPNQEEPTEDSASLTPLQQSMVYICASVVVGMMTCLIDFVWNL